jgi:2-polyprenyl-3-methyl-5-hydroxy-6-metoxy-1,4-benzoquinol methylase
MINYPTDGWVINPTDSNYSAKIKPLNQMTIDLKYKKNNFYDSNNNVYCIEGSRLKNNSIYRCYFNNNKWIAREERPDKKYPNSKNIIEIIQNQINFKMNLDTIDNSLIYNVYYSYNDNKISNDENIISSERNKKALEDNIDILSHIKEYTSKWLSECKDNNVLDVGCGKSSSIINWKRIEPTNIVGLDIDPVCIFKSTILSNSNNYLWFNLNEDWDIRSQVGYFGKIWEATQLFKMNNLLKIFDYIVFNFSIHYTTNYDKLVKNLIARSRNGTILKFNWIDYKQISIFDIQIKDNQVSINLPWKENTHTEPYFDYNKFIDVLKKNNLNFINQTKITEFHTKYQNWQSNIYYDTWQFN